MVSHLLVSLQLFTVHGDMSEGSFYGRVLVVEKVVVLCCCEVRWPMKEGCRSVLERKQLGGKGMKMAVLVAADVG